MESTSRIDQVEPDSSPASVMGQTVQCSAPSGRDCFCAKAWVMLAPSWGSKKQLHRVLGCLQALKRDLLSPIRAPGCPRVSYPQLHPSVSPSVKRAQRRCSGSPCWQGPATWEHVGPALPGAAGWQLGRSGPAVPAHTHRSPGRLSARCWSVQLARTPSSLGVRTPSVG